MLLITASYRRCGRNLRAKLYTVINSLSANHACLKTLCRPQWFSVGGWVPAAVCVSMATSLISRVYGGWVQSMVRRATLVSVSLSVWVFWQVRCECVPVALTWWRPRLTGWSQSGLPTGPCPSAPRSLLLEITPTQTDIRLTELQTQPIGTVRRQL